MEPASVTAAPPPRAPVRAAIRDLLTASAEYRSLDAATRREIAQGLVKICSTALTLAEDPSSAPPLPPQPAARAARVPLAQAQATAGQAFSGVAADRVAGPTHAILNAVSFPRFVTELINSVFKALVDSNQQQMAGYVELIRNVATTTEGFADMNMGPDRAREWLIE